MKAGIGVRDRRALWIGAVIVVPVLAWRGLVAPMEAAVARTEERAASARDLLSRERAALRDAPHLPALLAAVRAQGAAERPRLLGEADTVMAAAALANWVRDAARSAGLRDVQAGAGPVEPLGGTVRSVSVDLHASGDFGAVTTWISLMESGARALVVDRLEVSGIGAADGSVTLNARVRGFSADLGVARGGRP